jgi:flagellar assembly protein FliH
MATIIRAADAPPAPHVAALNFDDLLVQAGQYLDQVRVQATQIVARAQDQADAVRRQAAEQGRQAALQEVERMVNGQLAPVLSALRQAAADLQRAKQAWLSHWEASAVRVAGAIAARVVRRELRRQPEITLALVREALELAAGSAKIRVHLNPADHKTLGSQIQSIAKELSGLAPAELVANEHVSLGGARIETEFGVIDQQFEAQLARIEEELT